MIRCSLLIGGLDITPVWKFLRDCGMVAAARGP
jgi:hypothetical protein